MLSCFGRHASRLAFFIASFSICQSSNAASHYDAVRQFSLKTNPNGVWTYMDAAPFVDATRNYGGVPGLDNWSDGVSYPNGAAVIVNKTGEPVTLNDGATSIPTGYLALDAEANSVGAVVQFKAPAAGNYTFKCDVIGLNTDEARDVVLFVGLNGNYGFDDVRVHATTNKHLKWTISMAAGDTLSFMNRGDPHPGRDYVGLSVRVTGP